MGNNKYYGMCKNGIGRAVEIRTNRGTVHRGIIERVTPNKVYIRPLRGGNNNRGYGYGYYGGGYGWNWGWGGAAAGFALGAITSLAFLAFLW
ncbi:hypothetical protein ACFVHQ_11160 [Actinomycetes bacterium NPDC127524]